MSKEEGIGGREEGGEVDVVESEMNGDEYLLGRKEVDGEKRTRRRREKQRETREERETDDMGRRPHVNEKREGRRGRGRRGHEREETQKHKGWLNRWNE